MKVIIGQGSCGIASGAKKTEDVLLATCDAANKVTVYLKVNQKEAKDVLI